MSVCRVHVIEVGKKWCFFFLCYNQTVTQLSDLEGNPIPSLKHYEEERDALLKEIQTIGDMRRGTLIERYIP